jgi:hypothetical protein
MDSAYIDLAIGLAVAFLLLSLVVSAANEAIVRVLGVRAKFLWASLRDLLEPSDTEDGKSVNRTPDGVVDIVTFCISPTQDQRPAYRRGPSGTMTAAGGPEELTLVEDLHDRLSAIDFAKRQPVVQDKKVKTTMKTTMSQVPPRRLALALLEVIDGRYDGNVDAFVAALKKAGSPFAGPLKVLVDGSRGDRKMLRDGIEQWFDSEMTRLTAVYRRHVRWVITGLAVLITLFTGFDAIGYADSLLDDQAGREQLVAAVASGNVEQLGTLCEGGSSSPNESSTVDIAECFSSVIGHPALADAFDTSALGVRTGHDAGLVGNWDAWWTQVFNLSHVIGMVLTTVAIMFGAPFWWEVLRRLMGMRTRRPTTSNGTQ